MPIPLVLRPLLTILAVTGLLASPRGQAGPSNEDVRLYAFDCGGAYFDDIAAAADTGEYDGRPGRLVDPCFLIRHPRGWLLWDTGMPPTFPDGQKAVFDKMGGAADRVCAPGRAIACLEFAAGRHRFHRVLTPALRSCWQCRSVHRSHLDPES